jgi:hypothetical protein
MNRDYPELIRALLAKAESTTSDAERDAYNAKAEALMIKWGVSEAELLAKAKEDAPGARPSDHIETRYFTVTGPNAADLAHWTATQIAGAFGDIKPLWVQGAKQWAAVGYTRDIDRIGLYVPRLLEQARTGWNSYRRRFRGMDQSTRNMHKRAYFLGFGETAAERIKATLHAETGRTTGYALVLADKARDIDAYAQEHLTMSRTRGSRMDESSRTAGQRDGRRARINAGDMGGRARAAVGR